MAETILDRIMARKREEVSERRPHRSLHDLREIAQEQSAPRGFGAALRQATQEGSGVIAEVKRASPSKGRIRAGAFHPAEIAAGYAEAGAACISCLTDRDFFQGHEDYVGQIRARIDRPVLRKDFLYDPYQVTEARAIGADAILLIQAVLSVAQARELEHAAEELGMDVLVEVHDGQELEQAHALNTPLMGINNRNLKTFDVSLDTSITLAARCDAQRLVISESGIASAEDIRRLRDHGIRAYLIGERFMRAPVPGEALKQLMEEADG